MRLYSPDITKPTEINYYWHEKVLIEPMPRPKQGEWIVTQENGTHNYIYRCSVCEWYEYHAYPDVKGHNYCPNCGARMKGAGDE